MRNFTRRSSDVLILESDIISKNICPECYNNTQKIYQIRQTAFEQDRYLKEKCQQYLNDKGIRLPNTCITIRRESRPLEYKHDQSPEIVEDIKEQPQPSNECRLATPGRRKRAKGVKGLHPSVIDIYRRYPDFKLPRRSLDRHIAPVVSLTMNEVERYFMKKSLDINKYIYSPKSKLLSPSQRQRNVARKKTSTPFKRTSPLQIQKSFLNKKYNDNNYICPSVTTSFMSQGDNELDATKNLGSKSKKLTLKSNEQRDSFSETPLTITKPINKINGNIEKPTSNIKQGNFKPSPSCVQEMKGKNLNESKEMACDNNFIQRLNITAQINGGRDEKTHTPKTSTQQEIHISKSNIRSASARNSLASSTVKTSAQNSTKNTTAVEEKLTGSPIPSFNSSKLRKSKQQIVTSPSHSSLSSQTLKSNEVFKPNQMATLIETSGANSNFKQVPSSKSVAEIIKNVKRKLYSPKSVLHIPKFKRTSESAATSLDLADTSAIIDLEDDTVTATSGSSTIPLDITQPNNTTVISSQKMPSIHVLSLPNASKPEFIQSLGLTPATAADQFRKGFTCNICNSKHNSLMAFKKHSGRHRVCPFCKLKFRSVERKQKHIDRNNCEVKKIIESQGPFVNLEKIELNSTIRKKYRDTFSDYQIAPDADQENENLAELDDVIVISDNEEPSLIASNDNVSVKETATDYPLPEVPMIESVSIVRPIISIYEDDILKEVRNGLRDRHVVKELLLKTKYQNIGGKIVQTPAPAPCNRDLVIDNETCHFKNFKSVLLSFVVPLEISNGDFNVSFSAKSNVKRSAEKVGWNDVPVVNKRVSNPSKKVPLINATYPLTFVTSQVQSVSSIQVMTATPTMSIFLPNTSAFIPNAGLSIQPGINSSVTQAQAINNTFFSPIQTTSLLQNYTLNMAPVSIINNQVPVQSPSVNSPNVNGETGTKNGSIAPSSAVVPVSESSSSGKSSGRSLSGSLSKTASLALRSSLPSSRKTNSKTKPKRRILKVKIGNLASISTKSSKVRVKKIWELK